MGLGVLFDSMHYLASGSTSLPTASDWTATAAFVVLVVIFAVWVLPRHRLR